MFHDKTHKLDGWRALVGAAALLAGCNESGAAESGTEELADAGAEAAVEAADGSTSANDASMASDGMSSNDGASSTDAGAGSVDPCENRDCGEGGACVEDDGVAVCECDPGYEVYGIGCVPKPDRCDDVDCSGHGTCEVVDGSAKCACDDGYRTIGLDCVSSEECAESDTLDCGERGPLSACCKDGECFYVFADDTVLVGVSAMRGYCLGETDGSIDGYCSGIGNSCSLNPDPQSCAAVEDCYWTDPVPTTVEGCGEMYQTCVRGRRFRLCEDDEGVVYGDYEDGVRLYGQVAGLGYCFGENDGTEDGECVGVPSCTANFEPDTCNAAPLCTWTDP